MNSNPTSFKRAEFWQGFVIIAVLCLLAFSNVLFQHDLIISSPQSDVFMHFMAWREFAFDQLKHGHLVLWNPHYLCGTPFLGGFQSALLYPPNWFYMILPTVFAINFGIVLHVFLAGVFTYLWAFYRELKPISCLVAAVSFMFGGAFFLHVFAGHLPNLCVMAWTPLLFLAIDGLWATSDSRWILLGTFTVSMQVLAGHPQYVYFIAIMAFVYVILRVTDAPQRKRFLIGFIFFYVGSFFLTAVQLWIGLETFRECERHTVMSVASSGMFSFPPENLLTLFMPGFLGDLSPWSYWGRWFLWEDSLFMGVTSCFLVLTALFSVESRKRQWIFLTALIAFMLALGVYTPLFPFFHSLMPGFQGLRGFSKFDLITALFLSLAAGIGMEHWTQANTSKADKIYLWFVLGVSFFSFGLGVTIFFSSLNGLDGLWNFVLNSAHWLKSTLKNMSFDQRGNFIGQTGLQASENLFMVGSICLLIGLLIWLKSRNLKWFWGFPVLVLCELLFFAFNHHSSFPFSVVERKDEEIRELYQKDPGDYRVYGTTSASLVTNGYDLWEDEPTVLSRYGRFVCFTQGIPESRLFSTAPVFKKFTSVFALTRLKYILNPESDPIGIYRTPFLALPRMMLLTKWKFFSEPDEILPAMMDRHFDPADTVLLENIPQLMPSNKNEKGKVSWKDLDTERVEIFADNPTPSFLLVTDNYCPGWHIVPYADDLQKSYQIIPADYFLRAIALPAGHHHFLMEYRPVIFEIGKWVSLISWILYVAILIACWKKPVLFRMKANL